MPNRFELVKMFESSLFETVCDRKSKQASNNVSEFINFDFYKYQVFL